MFPNNFQEALDQEREAMEKQVVHYYYWRSPSPAHAFQTIGLYLHDKGIMTQGELSDLWSECFFTDIPYLPSMKEVSESSTWEDVFIFLECLKPHQLWTLASQSSSSSS